MNSKIYKVPEGLEEANENINQLIKWIESGGGYTQGLEVRFFNDVYRGVFLKKSAKVNTLNLKKTQKSDFKKDTEMLSIIPYSHLVSYERAGTSELWKKSQEMPLKFM